jgi:hypothetical protein
MWGLWWTKWHLGRFFSELSVFPCQFHSTGAPLIVKLGKRKLLIFIFIIGLHKKPLRLWCVRSICCGALHHVKKNYLPSTYPKSLNNPLVDHALSFSPLVTLFKINFNIILLFRVMFFQPCFPISMLDVICLVHCTFGHLKNN